MNFFVHRSLLIQDIDNKNDCNCSLEKIIEIAKASYNDLLMDGQNRLYEFDVKILKYLKEIDGYKEFSSQREYRKAVKAFAR